MTIKEIQEEIIAEFDMFEDWMERYEYIIDLGKSLPLIDEAFKTDDNLIKGCQSKVWLHSEVKDGTLVFTADSDAILTKGMVALLLRAFESQKPADIIKADMGYIDEIGLKEHLSATRANGLVSMIKQIKLYALGFQAKMNSQNL
jgi:cysteine desulfuration protein SufE